MRRESERNSGFCAEASSITDVISEVGAGSISELMIGRKLARVVMSGVSTGTATEFSFGVEPPAPIEFSIRPGVHPDRMSSPREFAVYSRLPKVTI